MPTERRWCRTSSGVARRTRSIPAVQRSFKASILSHNPSVFRISGDDSWHREKLVARAAVLGDGLLPVRRGVRPVVAPETARGVGVRLLTYVPTSRPIPERRCGRRRRGCPAPPWPRRPTAARTPASTCLAIVRVDRRRDLLRRLGAALVARLERGQALLLDEWQRGRPGAERERPIEGGIGQLKRVRRPVVAIDALHGVPRQSRHLRERLALGEVGLRLPPPCARSGSRPTGWSPPSGRRRHRKSRSRQRSARDGCPPSPYRP